MFRIKICGLTNTLDTQMAIEAGADALGFVLAPSPRQISLERLAQLTAGVPRGILRVAVLVNPTRQDVHAAVDAGADLVQLHGQEAPVLLHELESLGIPVLKALPLSPQSLPLLHGFQGGVLLDTGGGSGRTGDWHLARQIVQMTPGRFLALAGGLTPANVAQAIMMVQPSGVDVSSGVEASPGIKSPIKLQDFITQARSAWGEE